ncbi:MAG TPA: hypothetical protein VKD25_05125 [Burkholderiales bacterium]|nr:hypothetical protein [Burkholderiales bacterium]
MDGGKGPPNGHTRPLPEMPREEISEPGAYVDVATGALYRVPAQALVEGAPSALWEEMGAGSFVQVSRNPYIISVEARIICAAHDIRFEF